ncbi:hypothetical protein ABIF81_002837 [Bradyrhizobium daqingense]
MICLAIVGGFLALIAVVVLGLLAIVMKAQQHESGIE